jgi:peptide/nickel transport system permease protein
MFWLGGGLVTALILAAFLAPVIAPHDPLEMFRDAISATGDPGAPSERFLLGTDGLGRDYLSRLLYGARTTLMIGLGANLMATLLGLAVGATAALAGTLHLRFGPDRILELSVESVLMRLTDLWLSFPILLLTITVAFVLGASIGLVTVIIGITLWTATARIVYARMLVLRGSGFVEAARALGGGGRWIFRHHLLPHVTPLLVVYGSLGIATSVLFESTLSYLGAGVPPPAPTWGSMLANNITWFATDPRLVLLPGLCITVTVLAFNLLGDALRDALDPRAWQD